MTAGFWKQHDSFATNPKLNVADILHPCPKILTLQHYFHSYLVATLINKQTNEPTTRTGVNWHCLISDRHIRELFIIITMNHAHYYNVWMLVTLEWNIRISEIPDN